MDTFLNIQGKGELTTYWLVGKVSDDKGLNIDVPSGGYNSSSTSKAIYTIAEGEEQTGKASTNVTSVASRKSRINLFISVTKIFFNNN